MAFLLEGERASAPKPAPAARRGSSKTSLSGDGTGGSGLGLAFDMLPSGCPQHSLQTDRAAIVHRFVQRGGSITNKVMPTECPLPFSLPSSLPNGASTCQACDVDERRLPMLARGRMCARAQRAVHSKWNRSRRPLKRCRSKSSRRRPSPRPDRWPAALTSKLPLLLQISHLREVGKD